MIVRLNMRSTKYNPNIPYHVKVDRSSVLGNPYMISEYGSRDLVCDMYNEYFIESMMKGGEIYKAVLSLVDTYQTYGMLFIFCWCDNDQRCHSEIIINTVKQLYYEKNKKGFDYDEND